MEEIREIKVVIVGDANVGKTSFLVRFCDDEFSDAIVNIAVDFKEYVHEYNGTKYKILIWDTAGQERYRTITSSFYRETEAVILMYDIADNSSFDNLEKWISEIDANIPFAEKMIVGHKSDLIDERKIQTTEGEKWCTQRGFLFSEASSKSNENVKETLFALLDSTLSKCGAQSPQKKGVSLRRFEGGRKRQFPFSCVI